MAISVVNGYFCANSCDAAKAKKGEDPHPSTDPGSVNGNDRSSARADDPAVVFGGSLSSALQAQAGQSQAVAAIGSVQPDDQAAARRTGPAVDILA
jgi:hypothetical protein